MINKPKLKEFNVKKLLIIVLPIALLLTFCGILVAPKISQYNDTSMQSGISITRSLIINGEQNTKRDAPIDAKTGDVYFPQARLYLPVDISGDVLSYSYDPDEEILSVSSRAVFNEVSAKLYTAKDIEELFSHVPKLQSCQRGVSITRTSSSNLESTNVLKATIKLSNNDQLYIYQENDCPELNDTVERLKNLKQY